ncbi:MAG: hypothetical protein JSV21_04405 [Nitrospirota bacterium]|nr:MAG: hypothetical protein JSV21_04405 [Nitrospirota bacterium]
MTNRRDKFKEPFWLIESRDLYKGLYIELDATLKGIYRFFNPDNLPIDQDNLTEKNFFNELIILRDSILRVLAILEVALPESKKNAFWFSKFAEAKFYSETKRDRSSKGNDNSEDPERYVFELYSSFINFKNLIVDILKAKNISYTSFKNVGDIIKKEIHENRYFSPFMIDIDPRYDIIVNREISGVVKKISDPTLKRNISMSFIFLFRLLRYLDCIDTNTKRRTSLTCGLLLLSMVRSEIRHIVKFLEGLIGRTDSEELKTVLQPIIFSLTIEQKRVYNQELRNILQAKNISNLRGRIENSLGILKNLIEQSIVQIAEHLYPDIKGENIFATFITRLGQSMKLREDIYILHELLMLFEESLSLRSGSGSSLSSLKNFMQYFESFTFKLLRYDDYEEFSKFFDNFNAITREAPLKTDNAGKIMDSVHNFRIYLETTLNHISNRTELNDHPIDLDRARQLLNQYIR